MHFPLLRKGNYVFDIIENRARVFLLEDDKIILVPAGGNQYLLFNDKDEMFDILEKKGIPLTYNGGSPFQLNVDKLKQIEITWESIINELDSEILQMVEEKNYAAASKLIRKTLKKIPSDDRYKTIYLPLGILIHEIIRQHVNGKWFLEKQYYINPYYIPIIQDANEIQYNTWSNILKDLRRWQYFEISSCIKRARTKPIKIKIDF